MDFFLSWSRFSGLLLQVRLQETFRHLLNSYVRVSSQPDCLRQVEFKVAVLNGPVASFTDIPKKQDSSWNHNGGWEFGGCGRD
jgi:hypothetical protein